MKVDDPMEWKPLIDGWLLHLAAAGHSRATRATRRHQLNNLARGVNAAPEQVGTDALTAWMGAQHWSRETRRSYRVAARSFFRWAVSAGKLAIDPAAGLPRISAIAGVPRPAPDAVVARARLAADERTTLMLRLACEAGLRRGEVAALHSRDLCYTASGPALRVTGKGARTRMVPITAELAAELGACGDGWIFPSLRGGHLSAGYVGQLCSQVLGDGFALHTLRHRFASKAYQGSRDLRAVQALLGHQSVATTQIYVQIDDGAARAAMLAAVSSRPAGAGDAA